MIKRIFLRPFIAVATCFTLVCCACVSAGDTQALRPNILWLTMEDTSFFFGCYGDRVAKTPHIDRLAGEGTLFTRAFASSPVCSPARSALITGMYVGELGVGNHRSRVDIPDSVKGYPTYLKQAGYYCTNHTKNDFNFTNATDLAKTLWDDNSKNAHGRSVLDRQFEALTDEESMCRYWALIGLQAQQPMTKAIVQAAANRLTDSAPYVRYEAAFICCRYGNDAQAREVLVNGIHESHTILVNHAMRKIALLEKKAALFVDEVRKVRQTYKQLKDKKKTYEIGTSIDTIELCLADKYPSSNDSY